MNMHFGTTLSKRPLYCQVFDILARDIDTGIYPEGTYLPNEYDLANRFQVSIGTIRSAVERLVAEHRVVRQQGKGTLVQDQRWDMRRKQLTRIRFGEQAEVKRWQCQELSYQILPATAEVAQQLQILEGDSVHVIERLRHSDKSESKILDHAHAPVSLFPDFPADARGRRDAFGLAQRQGLLIGSCDTRVTALAASPHVASILEVDAGTPILAITRHLFTPEKMPLEARTMYCHLIDGYFWQEDEF